jgi:hypothetical protein
MNKIFLFLFTAILSLNLFSCAFLKLVSGINTLSSVKKELSSVNKEDDIQGNIHVYIENKTDEIILVNHIYLDIGGEKTGKSLELGRVSKSEIKMLNIKKGITIFFIGGNTRKVYFETICEKDYETFVIW